jgi:hypothetical protein
LATSAPSFKQRGADAGADGHDEHDAAPAPCGAEAGLRDAGGVGVVQHRAMAAGRPPDHGGRVRADPRLVDVRGGAHGSAHDDRRQRATDRAGDRRAVDQRRDHRRDGVGRRGIGVSIRIRPVAVPVARSTCAALMPEPPTSTPMSERVATGVRDRAVDGRHRPRR